MKRCITKISNYLFVAVFLAIAAPAFSQSEAQRLSAGFNALGTKYWGEFTDNQFWLGAEGFLRYNIFGELSIHGAFELSAIRYKTDREDLERYVTYFKNPLVNPGELPEEGDVYNGFDPTRPESPRIRDKNQTRVTSYDLYLSYNLFAGERFVPYIFGGIGYTNFDSKVGNTGYDGNTPNNEAGIVQENLITFPIGLGFELYLSDNVVFNGKAKFRLMTTDFLDDLAGPSGHGLENSSDRSNMLTSVNADDATDDLLVFGVGFSYYILGDADYDKDGLTNAAEERLKTDPRNPDTDGDGLKDGEEVKQYYTDPLKADTDGDNLTDYAEVFEHKTSPVKTDTDVDGLNDGDEIARKTDPIVADSDDDGLIDGDEVNKHQTNPLNKDTDSDGLNDGPEVSEHGTNPKAADSDNDGLKDGEEINQTKTNPAKEDTDGDGLKDGLEITQYKTDPLNPDTDADALPDGAEANEHTTNPLSKDTDGDGLEDGGEIKQYKTNPLNGDSDLDGLKDGEEANKYMTDPANKDTDTDGLNDGDEVLKHKTDPKNQDTDDDALADGNEVLKYKTNPLAKDTDNDKLTDGDEVNRTNTIPTDPDTDDDNIIDGDDDCPLVAGEPSNEKGQNGCPQPPKVGTKTDFPDILFIVNTDRFNFDWPGTSQNLAKLLAYVKQCEGLQVVIEGHASEEGTQKRNQELSDMRAKRVRQWLIEQGVNPDVIQGAIGYGTSQPKIPEPKGAALKKISKDELENIRKQNRRITVKVVKTCDSPKK